MSFETQEHLPNDVAISVRNLTKTFRLFDHPGDRIKQFFSFGLKRYHREFTALKDISFDIKKGETVGVIGRNGSGKSALLQLIAGILKPSAGSVVAKGKISALLELGAGFNPEFTGRENIYFYGTILGLTKKQIDARFENIISFADIGIFIDEPVRTYSSGMFVRLAFATMIHIESDILIIDEALAVGDEAFQGKCLEKISNYVSDGKKIAIIVSHNTRQLERICSKIIWLDHGKLISIGGSKDACNKYIINTQEQILNSEKTMTPTISTGELSVDNFTLCNALTIRNSTTVEPYQSINIHIDFNCLRNLINPEIIIEIQTPDSIPIASASTRQKKPVFEILKGQHRLKCTFVNPPLLPGIYQFKLVFLDSNQRLIWKAQNLCKFRVNNKPEANLLETPKALIDIPFEIEINTTPNVN